jgi:hypothetical protein
MTSVVLVVYDVRRPHRVTRLPGDGRWYCWTCHVHRAARCQGRPLAVIPWPG